MTPLLKTLGQVKGRKTQIFFGFFMSLRQLKWVAMALKKLHLWLKMLYRFKTCLFLLANTPNHTEESHIQSPS